MTQKEMAEVFAEMFEFPIRSIVYIKTATHTTDVFPQRNMVLAQEAELCPGGIQLHYILDHYNTRVLEILLSSEPPPVVEMHKDAIAEQVRIAGIKQDMFDWFREHHKSKRAAKAEAEKESEN